MPEEGIHSLFLGCVLLRGLWVETAELFRRGIIRGA